MSDDAFQRVRRIVADVLNVPERDLTLDFEQANTPAWDSLHHVHLITAIEGEFNISIDADQLLELTSIEAIVSYVASQG